MEKTKDIEIEVGGIKRVFRLHPVSFQNIGNMRDAINRALVPNGNTSNEIYDIILSSVEMINDSTQESMGFKKKDELEALLGPFALYEVICQAIEHQEAFCGAYPKSLELISAVKSLVCANGLG